jgi:hypothetical protein
MNPVARVEDERFHLGIPTPGLVSEMDASIQQFLDANTDHSFPFVRSPGRKAETDHPAEHGIEFSVIMAAHPHTGADLRPFPFGRSRPKRVENLTQPGWNANGLFERIVSSNRSQPYRSQVKGTTNVVGGWLPSLTFCIRLEMHGTHPDMPDGQVEVEDGARLGSAT